MKKSSSSTVAIVLVAVVTALIPSQGAFALGHESSLSPAAIKAGLNTCAAVDRAVAFANAFSSRKKSSDAATEKAKQNAAMSVLKADFGAVAKSYDAALRADLSYKSWQGPLSTVLSFDGNNGDVVDAALVTINGLCAKLRKL